MPGGHVRVDSGAVGGVGRMRGQGLASGALGGVLAGVLFEFGVAGFIVISLDRPGRVARRLGRSQGRFGLEPSRPQRVP